MFSDIFISRPRFAVVISLFLMLAGILCLPMLPVSEYPQVAPPTIMVTATYPGASAQVIADTVAAPLEAEINGIENMIYYSSKSDNSGSYSLTLTFKSGADENMALVNVNNAVKRAEAMLPRAVTQYGLPVFKRSSDILTVLSISSSNPEHTPLFISNYAITHIKDALSRIEGVGQATIFGEQRYSIRVWLDPYKMQACRISEQDIANAISTQNIQAAAGAIGTEMSSDSMQFKIDTKGRLSTPEEFAEIVVKTGPDGRQVRLKDVARVELAAENPTATNTFNGRSAVPLAVFKLNDANALGVMKKLQSVMDELAANFPEGMTWVNAYDSTSFIKVSMQEIIITLLMTFVLVILITGLFLQDWRATIIPAATIPVSLVGTFFFLYLAGMSINTLTMFALILVIGSVVDDAICVTENCTRLINEEHLSPADAARTTMRQLTGALIATTLVVVAIYVPIMFYGGMVGTIYTQFSVTMCIALCLSTVNALTLSPALCALVLRPARPKNRFFRGFDKVLDWTRNGYLFCAGILVRRAVLTIVLMGAILAGNWFFFGKLHSAFLPPEDKGALFCEITLPTGAAVSRTEKALEEVADIIRQVPGVKDLLTIPGSSLTSGNAENLGMIIIPLKPWSERKTPELSNTSIQRKILAGCAGLPDVSVNCFVPPAITGLGTTGGVTGALQASGGQNSRELAGTIQFLISKLMASGKALYAFSSFSADTPMIYLDIDRKKAEALDVPVSSIFSALQSQLGGSYINDINKAGKTYKVKIQLAPELRSNYNILPQLQITSLNGDKIPLSAIARVNWTIGPRQVERFNMFPSASLNVQGVPGFSSGEMMDLIRNTIRQNLSKDFRISWTDMSYQEETNQGKIVHMLLISLLVAYLFLVAQYESWTMPISVMLSVATGTLGAILVLFLTGHGLDIYCQLGLLMLIGLVAKTAILMVEFSKQERDDGAAIPAAAIDGMRMRFRSVMMTALSFVIGVFPLVVATGAGAGSRQAIGITTFWGMLAATVAGMIFIPGLYAIFQYCGEWCLKRVKKGAAPEKLQ